jgi:hypothetical protein
VNQTLAASVDIIGSLDPTLALVINYALDLLGKMRN